MAAGLAAERARRHEGRCFRFMDLVKPGKDGRVAIPRALLRRLGIG